MRQNLGIGFSYENPLRKKFGDEFFKSLTLSPGVYFMLDRRGSILYIGKAKNLKNRVSHYSKIKPGQAPDHTLEMIDRVHSIQWQVCSSESEALHYEKELLHAIRPPFNIADTELNHYLFIAVKSENKRKTKTLESGIIAVDFQLTHTHEVQGLGYQVYGCYKHRGKTKKGYTAFLRLLHAVSFAGASHRFSYPAKISRASPPWSYTSCFPEGWWESFHRFLKGEDSEILNLMIQRMLEADTLPSFVYPAIQSDLDIVKEFYQVGPYWNFGFKMQNRLTCDFILPDEMDRRIAQAVKLKMSRKSA